MWQFLIIVCIFHFLQVNSSKVNNSSETASYAVASDQFLYITEESSPQTPFIFYKIFKEQQHQLYVTLYLASFQKLFLHQTVFYMILFPLLLLLLLLLMMIITIIYNLNTEEQKTILNLHVSNAADVFNI
jgi:hypothetical protein